MEKDTYALLDIGDSQRLERWGDRVLIRPDPTAAGAPMSPAWWDDADAFYDGEKGKGEWVIRNELPESWPVAFDDVQLLVRLAPYKHTGVFPEQAANWRWAREHGKGRTLNILNLFAYTGGMTMALAKDGHVVTHVDSSKPTIAWAKENAALNGLPPDAVRWIVDDASTFVGREYKRDKRYDAIILDPPAYGHGPSGKAWRVERDLAPLLETCAGLLSDDPAFLILNGYAKNDSPDSLRRLVAGVMGKHLPTRQHAVHAEELMLRTADGRELSTGVTVRCGL